MSRTASPSSGTPCGLARVCRVWRTAPATVYRHRSPAPADPASSPALVRAPEGNGCAGRFSRTLKENLLRGRSFDTAEQLRHALIEFREACNTTWLLERHGFRPPAALRAEQLPPAARAA